LLSSKKDLVPSTTKTALQLDILEFGALAEAERYRDLLDPGDLVVEAPAKRTNHWSSNQ